MRRSVVVTGAGVISPLADSPAGLHAALCEGRSALKPIELFPTDGIGCRQAGEIRPFEPRDYL
jgi:3-oxoacyl-[acyl-carrier-protein] synthase II